MKIYRVTIKKDKDNKTTKHSVGRTELYFAAKSIDTVFGAALEYDGEITDIMEVFPEVIVLD
jgi:hypothetical protein